MSSPEQQNPSAKPEFKLVMPSLPPLYDGVFEEVYADYLSDPEKFKVSTLYHIEQDNPALIPFYSTEELFEEDEVSVKWPLIYYEMFARSSRKDGLPPIQITEYTVDTVIGLFGWDINIGLNNIEEAEEQIKRSRNRAKMRRERDQDYSAELVKFWNTVDHDLNKQLEGGAEELQFELYLVSLRRLQEMLQRQHDEYSLAGQYLSPQL